VPSTSCSTVTRSPSVLQQAREQALDLRAQTRGQQTLEQGGGSVDGSGGEKPVDGRHDVVQQPGALEAAEDGPEGVLEEAEHAVRGEGLDEGDGLRALPRCHEVTDQLLQLRAQQRQRQLRRGAVRGRRQLCDARGRQQLVDRVVLQHRGIDVTQRRLHCRFR
jgi:hypothetical protein